MKRIAMLFPGQGSFELETGLSLYNSHAVAKSVFDEASETLGYNILQEHVSGDDLTRTEYMQPAILTNSVAAFQVYTKEIGIKPLYCAGHSLGEYSALVCTNSISFADALMIVKNRGEIMQKSLPENIGGMVALRGVEESIIYEECLKVSTAQETISIACYNSIDQIVVSGHRQAIDRLLLALKKYTLSTVFLNVNYPFHSPMMKKASRQFRQYIEGFTFSVPETQVLSSVIAIPYRNSDEIKQNLVDQIIVPVQWLQCMEYLKNRQIDATIEFGSKKTLTNMLRRHVDTSSMKMFLYPLELEESKSVLIDEKSSGNTDYDGLIQKCLTEAVTIRNDNDNLVEYNERVVIPYNTVKEKYDKRNESNRKAGKDDVIEAIEMIVSVYRTKKTDILRGERRIRSMLEMCGIDEDVYPLENALNLKGIKND